MAKKFCTGCGAEVNGLYCPKCGKELDDFQKDKEIMSMQYQYQGTSDNKDEEEIYTSEYYNEPKALKHNVCTYVGLGLLVLTTFITVLGMIISYLDEYSYAVKSYNAFGDILGSRITLMPYFALIILAICLCVAMGITVIRSKNGGFMGIIFSLIYLALTIITAIIALASEGSGLSNAGGFTLSIYVGSACYFVGALCGLIFLIASIVLFIIGFIKEKNYCN